MRAALLAALPLLSAVWVQAVAAQNRPPDCSTAAAVITNLWPPSHKLAPVSITGVTDPDSDPVSIAVTGITQDEPLDQGGDGSTTPDAMIDADGLAHVRVERSGSGNGRVYRITFVAADGHGGTCDGAVTVCVPHDQRRGGSCVDDGQDFNSLGSSPSPSPSPAPIPIIDQCKCSDTVFVQTAGGGLTTALQAVEVTDVGSVGYPAPRDTCPAEARIDIRWHAEPPDVIGYRYRLGVPEAPPLGFPVEQPPWIEVGPEVTNVTYNSGVPPDTVPPTPGPRVFTLGAIDQAHVERDTTRRFQLDYLPDSWWAGPDLSSASFLTKPNGEKFALLVGGKLASPISGSLLSPDSVQVRPALRTQRNTFFEIWKDTVFARQDGDTVHMNAWVVLHSGGFDRDSRYRVRVTEAGRQLPDFPGGPVLEPGPANGSPIGFHSQLTMSLWPDDSRAGFAQTGLYPLFDPNSVFHLPRIASYFPIFKSGRAFVDIRAEDGDGFRDNRIPNGRDLVLRIESGTATPAELALRSKVLTFYTDRPPYFVTSSPLFRPRTTAVDTFRTSVWGLRLVANDDDPYQWDTLPGGPSAFLTLRRKIEVHGKDIHGNALTYVDPTSYINQQDIQETVPDTLAGGPCTLEVELCDCDVCQDQPGSGRCVTLAIPVFYQPEPAGSASAPGAMPMGSVAARTLLFAPYPNPASGGATIRFSLAAAGTAEIEIYNLAGRLVRRLTAERLSAGEHSSVWTGEDGSGRRVAAGIYFVRLRSAGATVTRKLFVVG